MSDRNPFPSTVRAFNSDPAYNGASPANPHADSPPLSLLRRSCGGSSRSRPFPLPSLPRPEYSGPRLHRHRANLSQFPAGENRRLISAITLPLRLPRWAQHRMDSVPSAPDGDNRTIALFLRPARMTRRADRLASLRPQTDHSSPHTHIFHRMSRLPRTRSSW
jgi:hypothetical protein